MTTEHPLLEADLGGLDREEAAYLMWAVDFYRHEVTTLVDTVPVTELVPCLAYLVAAMSTQVPVLEEGFQESLRFFKHLYPVVLKAELEAHPELRPAADEESLVLVIPSPVVDGVIAAPDSLAVDPDEPRIIHPGSRKVQ